MKAFFFLISLLGLAEHTVAHEHLPVSAKSCTDNWYASGKSRQQIKWLWPPTFGTDWHRVIIKKYIYFLNELHRKTYSCVLKMQKSRAKCILFKRLTCTVYTVLWHVYYYFHIHFNISRFVYLFSIDVSNVNLRASETQDLNFIKLITSSNSNVVDLRICIAWLHTSDMRVLIRYKL